MLANSLVSAALPASDIERAKKFYGESLGLKISKEDPSGIVFECGGGTSVFVYPSGFAGTNKATAAGWEVADLESEVAELRAKGVNFEEYDLPGLKTENGIATIGDEKAAWFKDSEGNILAVSQRS